MLLFHTTCTMDIYSPLLTFPIQFSQSLKTYSTQDPDSSPPHTTVISFDFDAFNLVCNKDSLSYDQTLRNYDALAAELFKVDEIGSSKDLMEKVMKSLSKFQVWSVSKEKLSLRCNRFQMRIVDSSTPLEYHQAKKRWHLASWQKSRWIGFHRGIIECFYKGRAQTLCALKGFWRFSSAHLLAPYLHTLGVLRPMPFPRLQLGRKSGVLRPTCDLHFLCWNHTPSFL